MSETQTTTTSDVGASSRGVAASVAPSDSGSSALPGVRFQTVSGKPARARFAAIAAPIVPMPQKPTRHPVRLPDDPTARRTPGAPSW